jgi:signal transduction histidine kinase
VSQNPVNRLLAEPPAPHAPERVWRDWALVAAVTASAVLEGLFRPDVVWRPMVTVTAVLLGFTLLWRRTHPLAMVAVVFGTNIVMNIAAWRAETAETVGLYMMVFCLILSYALFRWASGRDVLIGTAILAVGFGTGIAADYTSVGETVAALVFFSFPAVLGVSVRFFTTLRSRELDQMRLREREQLARELHDTVAHHVSAMVIRAQAGRVVAASSPRAAVEALQVIEEEGARTLEEMRLMVGALRDGAAAELAPAGGVADLERLAASVNSGLVVQVVRDDQVADLTPAVDAALYRIAQESITNAMRHARHARRVVVDVSAADGLVRLVVRDDGEPVPWTRAGYGITGMTERVALLGGTFSAGPGAERGWVVETVLPRVGSAS